jgi:XTP/dITP diphosphohydrolase
VKQFLIATTNPGKLREITKFLADLPIELISLDKLNIKQRVEETGSTFKENAIIKARFYKKISGLLTLADDGGAEIDALNGEPSVKTRRWVHQDRDSTDEELIAYTLKKLNDVPFEQRGMQLRLVLVLATPGDKIYTSEAKIRGIVATKPHGQAYEGFPFRRLMYLPEIGKFYNHDLLTPHENEKLNHRKRALEKLKPIIKKLLLK